jgi:hypothetical protein
MTDYPNMSQYSQPSQGDSYGRGREDPNRNRHPKSQYSQPSQGDSYGIDFTSSQKTGRNTLTRGNRQKQAKRGQPRTSQ